MRGQHLVTRLSHEMQDRLTENAHKGDWRTDTIHWLAKLEEEVEEFVESLLSGDGRHWIEGGDIAAVVAMMCDVVDQREG